MASTSDPPAVGGIEASSAATATTAVSTAPSADPPPPPSSSKRRWSPCTWRYAIEEVQPELGSRPRSSTTNAPYPPSSLRAGSEHAAAPPTTSKSRPHHSQDHVSVKEAEEPARRSAYGSRTWGSTELSELRARHAQPARAQDLLSKKKCRVPQPQAFHQQHHHQKQPAKWPKEENRDEDWDGEDDGDGDGGDVELGHHFEGSRKRKKREMSPSELYYCDLCRVKAATEAAKVNVSVDGVHLSQDP